MQVQADFLFGDVQFFEIEDDLLLEAVFVHFHFRFAQVFAQAFFDLLHPRFFKRLDLGSQRPDVSDVRSQFPLQDRPFRFAIGYQRVRRLSDGALYRLPGLLGELFAFAPEDIRQAHGDREAVGGGERRFDGLQLLPIGGYRGGVDVVAVVGVGCFGVDEQVDLPTHQPAGEVAAYFQFFFPQQRRDAGGEVHLFSVEGFDLYRQFFVVQFDLCAAESGHRSYHGNRV